VQLENITPLIPSVSPRFGGALNISLIITPDIANGEIGFTSNQTVVALEPEDSNSSLVYKTLMDILFIYLFILHFSKSILMQI